MSAVLRIALAYFEMVPLQRWLNLGGALLFAVAALLGVFAETVDDAKGVFMACLFGVILIVIVPAFGGAFAMRMASRPSVVHLRPHGRRRMLLGTTLAITLIVMLLAVPSLAANAVMVLRALKPANRFGDALGVLVLLWPMIAMGWIILFAASRTMLVALLFPLVVMGGMKVTFLLQAYPRIAMPLLVAVGPVAWLTFAIWYLRAGRIRQMQLPYAGASASAAERFPLRWLFDLDPSRSPTTSPAAATFHYLLGCGSYRLFAMTGAWMALLFLLMQVVVPRGPSSGKTLLISMLPFLAFNSAVMGYTTARRARLLWLRAGTDRAGIFAVAEKLGLRASMATWGVVAGAVLVHSMLTNPERAPWMPLFVASQGAAAICMFYGGFALVRDWSARDKALTVVLAILFLLQVSVFGPSQTGNLALPWTALLVIASVLALALRWYARRQWRVLDWRLIKPPRLDWRRT
jgi:uncharacterized membrane-anchored protein